MRHPTLLRASLLLAALGAALSAQAVTIGLSSVGSATVAGVPTTLTVDEEVVVQQGGFGALSTLHYSATQGGFPLQGDGTYSGPGGTLNFHMVFMTDVLGGLSQTVSGTWTATSGTGTYVGVTGTGTFATSATVTLPQPYATFTIFRGDIEAVPEPASLAALGLGAAALLRQRKRS